MVEGVSAVSCDYILRVIEIAISLAQVHRPIRITKKQHSDKI